MIATVLAIVNISLYSYFVKQRFRWIVVHHTASDYGNYDSIKTIHKKKHKWVDAGYHLILSNGSTNVPMGFLEATSRYKFLSYSLASKSVKHNILGVHICVVGNFETNPVPNDLRGPLAFCISKLQDMYDIPDERILLHRDVGQTLCPGKNVSRTEVISWKKQIQSLSNRVKNQQEKVISNAQYSLHTFPPIYILAAICSSTLILLLFWFSLKKNEPPNALSNDD